MSLTIRFSDTFLGGFVSDWFRRGGWIGKSRLVLKGPITSAARMADGGGGVASKGDGRAPAFTGVFRLTCAALAPKGGVRKGSPPYVSPKGGVRKGTPPYRRFGLWQDVVQ